MKEVWRKGQSVREAGSLLEIDAQRTVEPVVVTRIQEEETNKVAALRSLAECRAVEDFVVEPPAPSIAITKNNTPTVVDISPILPYMEHRPRGARNASRGSSGGVPWRRMID
jgi:hypothetical protein